jgi:hypothetical protein
MGVIDGARMSKFDIVGLALIKASTERGRLKVGRNKARDLQLRPLRTAPAAPLASYGAYGGRASRAAPLPSICHEYPGGAYGTSSPFRVIRRPLERKALGHQLLRRLIQLWK